MLTKRKPIIKHEHWELKLQFKTHPWPIKSFCTWKVLFFFIYYPSFHASLVFRALKCFLLSNKKVALAEVNANHFQRMTRSRCVVLPPIPGAMKAGKLVRTSVKRWVSCQELLCQCDILLLTRVEMWGSHPSYLTSAPTVSRDIFLTCARVHDSCYSLFSGNLSQNKGLLPEWGSNSRPLVPTELTDTTARFLFRSESCPEPFLYKKMTLYEEKRAFFICSRSNLCWKHSTDFLFF